MRARGRGRVAGLLDYRRLTERLLPKPPGGTAVVDRDQRAIPARPISSAPLGAARRRTVSRPLADDQHAAADASHPPASAAVQTHDDPAVPTCTTDSHRTTLPYSLPSSRPASTATPGGFRHVPRTEMAAVEAAATAAAVASWLPSGDAYLSARLPAHAVPRMKPCFGGYDIPLWAAATDPASCRAAFERPASAAASSYALPPWAAAAAALAATGAAQEGSGLFARPRTATAACGTGRPWVRDDSPTTTGFLHARPASAGTARMGAGAAAGDRGSSGACGVGVRRAPASPSMRRQQAALLDEVAAVRALR